MASRHHRISSLRVELSERSQIKQLIESLAATPDWRWTWSDDGDAETLIIDVDSVAGHVEWLRARAAGYNTLPLSNQGNGSSEAALVRPITSEGLERALRAIARRVGQPDAAAGSADADEAANTPLHRSPATPPNVVPIAAAGAEPQLELIDFLTSSAPTGAVRLARPDLPSLTLDPERGSWFGPTSLKALSPYCEGGIAVGEWQRVSPAVLAGLRDSGAAQPLSRLVWFATLLASRGRLLTALDPRAVFRIARWPRLEREFPRHFRVANALMKQPGSIAEVAAASGVPAAEVIGFVNAYYMIGSVVPVASAAELAVPAGEARVA